MPQTTWFICDKCGAAVAAIVPERINKLERSCECGGTFVRK